MVSGSRSMLGAHEVVDGPGPDSGCGPRPFPHSPCPGSLPPGSGLPTHLYERVPKHMMSQDANGDLTPDYLKMILLSRVYTPPLNMKETPLTKAVNLSAKLGCEIWLKREELQDVFSFKIRGAYNFMSSLDPEERWKGVVTCSAGASHHRLEKAQHNMN